MEEDDFQLEGRGTVERELEKSYATLLLVLILL